MAIKDYKFVSPGVQIHEIDQSVLEPTRPEIGPVIIGKFLQGPAFTPVIVNNKKEFREMFGGVIAGDQPVDDVWRAGNNALSPSYASIAVEAHLDAATVPATVVRLLGEENENSNGGDAGWSVGVNNVANSAGNIYALVVGSTTGSGANRGLNPDGVYVVAKFYSTGTSIRLKGTNLVGALNPVSGTNVWVQADSNGEFTAELVENGVTKTINFTLDDTKGRFIRKVFNTNPTFTNSNVTATTTKYWLGETYEKTFDEKLSSSTTVLAAALVQLKSVTNASDPGDFKFGAQQAKSGWIFSQDLGKYDTFGLNEEDYTVVGPNNKIENTTQKLFRFASISKGKYEQENYKIVINNIRQPTQFSKYATFDVTISPMNQLDQNFEGESYLGLDLNPSSQNYIAKRIGDKYLKWDYTQDKLVEKGDYDNVSSVVRVEMHPDLLQGRSTEGLLPFGFYGPVKYKDTSISASQASADESLFTSSYIRNSGSNQDAYVATGTNDSGTIKFGANNPSNSSTKIIWPTIPLVTTIKKDKNDSTSNFFGINKGTKDYAAYPNNQFMIDLCRPLGGQETGAYEITDKTSGSCKYSFVFTLDDVAVNASTLTASWAYGNRQKNLSYTAISGANEGEHSLIPDSNDLKGLETNGFVLPLVGGFDGFNITEKEPLRNSLMDDTKDEFNSYVYNTYKVGIGIVSDPEVVNMNVLAIPGLTNPSLTKLMIDTCEQRSDALAIIDLEGDFLPAVENSTDKEDKKPTGVKQVINSLKGRKINSSYGCAYFPWVRMAVVTPKSTPTPWVPPSVVALGTFASSEAKSQLWFAPAGFNRGGLKLTDSRGKYGAGFQVIDTALQLTSKQRDNLYEVNINPIANFVNEGIVVFGQKTLQVSASALDRINVRRLLIYLKKRVSIIASGILFDPNVEVTWARFKSATDSFLSGVKAGLGLVDYKVVLDKTTTTDELIDRNILYAKIYVKPARAIEFIAVDFIITKSGASFND